MNEDKLASLNDIQDFFNRSHSTSASGTFSTKKIGIKNFIGWCNNPCNNISESNDGDSAYWLGNTICVLEKLSDDKIDAIEEILAGVVTSAIGNTDPLTSEQKKQLFNNACTELLKYDELRSKLEEHLGVEQGKLTKTSTKDLPVNAAFYCALKLRLKDYPDERGYYHYQFDDSGNTVAQVDPLKPFTDSSHDNLDQQWHILISLLALLDVAHALSCEHHEHHCLYPYLSSYDKGDLNKMRLKLKSSLSLDIESRPSSKKAANTNYHSGSMMAWIKNALFKRTGD